MSGESATLIITRNEPEDVQDRWIRLSIDGQPEEILRYGETLTRELAPGQHVVKAHNTLSRHQVTFAAAAGERVRFRCHNKVAKGGVLMMLTTGFAFITVRLERDARE